MTRLLSFYMDCHINIKAFVGALNIEKNVKKGRRIRLTTDGVSSNKGKTHKKHSREGEKRSHSIEAKSY